MLIAQENKNMAREGFGPKVQLFTILILNFRINIWWYRI